MSRLIPARATPWRRLAVLSLGSLVAACGGEKPPVADSTAAAPAPVAEALPPATEGFKVPESVRYDAALDAYFVSNIDGNPNQKDNNGAIVRLDAANPGAPVDVVRGGQNGVTLHAPKGMAIAGDTLWVADIDAVRAFDKNTGAVLATIDLAPMGATFLNDVAIASDGTLYITDTGIAFSATGELSHPGKDRIFAIAGGKASIALESDSLLTRPNGIAWDGGQRALRPRLVRRPGDRRLDAGRADDHAARHRPRTVRWPRSAGRRPPARHELGRFVAQRRRQRDADPAQGGDGGAGRHRRRHQAPACRRPALQCRARGVRRDPREVTPARRHALDAVGERSSRAPRRRRMRLASLTSFGEVDRHRGERHQGADGIRGGEDPRRRIPRPGRRHHPAAGSSPTAAG